MGESKHSFLAPCVICLPFSEDHMMIHSDHPLVAKEMAFHPLFIHPEFDKVDPESMWIQAFNHRDAFYQGILSLDPLTNQRIEALMEALGKVLTSSEDAFGICRARSFLIEALVTIDRLYMKAIEENQNAKNSQSQETFLSVQQPFGTSQLIDDILTYLHTHYHQEITIEGLCSLFLINRTSLNQQFKAEVGQTITQYLIHLRLSLALKMLQYTFLSINEIMQRVGYTDLTHFNRAFKQHTGTTPSAYRRQFKSS